MTENSIIKIKLMRHSERLDHTKILTWMTYIGYYGYHVADSPLSQNGLVMAANKGIEFALEDDFKPKIIYCSPYDRTKNTAIEVMKPFPEAKLQIVPLLSEFQFWYGHTIAAYPNGIPTEVEGVCTDFAFPESEIEFARRVKFIIDHLISKTHTDCIIVSHGEFIKVYAEYITSIYPEISLELNNTPYLTTISFDYDKVKNAIIPQSVKISF